MKKRRNSKGSAMLEAGPALFILFIFLLYPLINLLGLGFSYYSVYTLNDIQTREASLLRRSEAMSEGGIILKQIPDAWKNQGLGRFANVLEGPETVITYTDGTADNNGVLDKVVHINTRIICRPCISVPWFAVIPGLGAPVTFGMTSSRVLENPDNASS